MSLSAWLDNWMSADGKDTHQDENSKAMHMPSWKDSYHEETSHDLGPRRCTSQEETRGGARLTDQAEVEGGIMIVPCLDQSFSLGIITNPSFASSSMVLLAT